jgi:peptidoglycan/LPS O-acetylase OafA/YrhL
MVAMIESFSSRFPEIAPRISSLFNRRTETDDLEGLSTGLLSNPDDIDLTIGVNRTTETNDLEGLSTGPLSNSDHIDITIGVNRDVKQWHRFDSTQALLPVRIISSALRLLLFAFTPSFIYNQFSSTAPRKLHRTSFLDGLRGVSAFAVLLWHYLPGKVEPWLLPAYGAINQGDMGPNPLQLPFIRVLYAGSTMVHIFFIISGYVLSSKHIRMIRSENHEKLADSLVSTIFRRAFRLFLPSIAGQIFRDLVYYIWYSTNPGSPGAWLQRFINNTRALLFYWEWDLMRHNLEQFWTIPVEFVCSMFIFLVILGVSQVRTWLRFSILGLLMLHTFGEGRWGVFLFLVGMIIAEIDEIREEINLIQKLSGIKEQGTGPAWKSMFHTLFWVSVLLIGLFLAGVTEQRGPASAGFEYLLPYTPEVYDGNFFTKFWASVSAVLLLLALCQLPALQVVFTTPIPQYLGDVSYSLYIVHYVLVRVFGGYPAAWAHTWVGVADTHWKRILCVLLEVLMFSPMVIWVADIFYRLVDKPVVEFSRWLEKICRKPSASNYNRGLQHISSGLEARPTTLASGVDRVQQQL